jgi:hypothetical protein
MVQLGISTITDGVRNLQILNSFAMFAEPYNDRFDIKRRFDDGAKIDSNKNVYYITLSLETF